jgi:hypothetical protein
MALVAELALPMLAGAAAPPGTSCQAAKLRATGREVRDFLHCRALGAGLSCYQSADKRDDEGIRRADSRPRCLTNGDSDAIGERVTRM